MSTLPTLPEQERPGPLRPVLVMLGAVTLGSYVLFGGLALADRANGRWGLALVPVAVLCFAVAAAEASRLLRRQR